MVAKTYRYASPPLGRLGLPRSGWTFSVGLDQLSFDAHLNKHFLLVCEPKDVTIRRAYGPYPPIGGKPGLHWSAHGDKVTIYPGATLDRSSANDDIPAAIAVEARMVPSLNYKRELFSSTDPLGRSNPGEGVLELVDVDGTLNYLFDYVWDGAPVTIKRGLKTQMFSEWETVGKFTAADILSDADHKSILLRSVAWPLDGLLHDNYYDGTGGLGGDPELAGVWKPYTVGWCFNVEPRLINAQYSIYQWSFTSSQEVIAFKHAGVELDFHADYDTYEDLVAALDALEIPSGHYGTCLAHSLAAPNITITNGIRVDVKGDADVNYGHPAPSTRSEIARRIATSYGKNRLNDATQIDITSFNALQLRHSAVLGFHFPSEVTKAAALNEVMSGILGWWYIRPATGQLAVGYARSLKSGSIGNLEFGSEGMGKPIMEGRTIPRAGTNIAYQKNYGPQDRNDLALSVDDETALILKNEAKFATSSMPYIRVRYPSATTVTVNGGFWYKEDADVECSRQQNIMSIPRARYQWTMRIDPHADLLDKIMTLVGADRLMDFGAAKPLLCVGMDSRGTGTVTTSWWG